MIKVCELVRRKPGMSIEAFREHWRSKHGPIVAAIPHLRRYVQSHPLLGGYRKGPLPVDGVAELWFDDKEHLRSLPELPEFHAAKADEAGFIDTGSMVELIVDEHVLKDGRVAADAIKCISLLRFRADLSPGDAQAYWRHTHGAIASQIPGLQRYVQSHVRPGAYRGQTRPAWDGLAITWFDSVDAMRAVAASSAYAATRADEPNFLAPGPVPQILTREHEVVGN